MPAFIPFIIGGLGAGARILGAQAARQGAAQAARGAAKTTVKKAAKKTTSTAKKTTPRKTAATKRTPAKRTPAKTTPAKRTPAARRPAQRDVLTAGERAQLRAERDARRLAGQGNRAGAAKRADRARSLGATQTARARAANRARGQTKIKKLRRTALTTGASSLAYEAAKYASTVPKNTKNQMPMRPRNWNPNKGL